MYIQYIYIRILQNDVLWNAHGGMVIQMSRPCILLDCFSISTVWPSGFKMIWDMTGMCIIANIESIVALHKFSDILKLRMDRA